MSPAIIYVAIVVMWLCVLVPMWLRRDKSHLAELQEELYDVDEMIEVASEPETYDPDTLERSLADFRHIRARHRAIIVARRRRMLFFSVLLVLASVITAAVKVIPWWGVAPSGVVLLAYLGVLRIAVKVDRERRMRAVQARRERARRREQRRLAELAAREAAEAEVIAFTARQEDVLFDQYADPPRRAVGD
ncbi:hypothetical protein [Thermoactinospora rubra]|uniref:divisome protein SepX/GlpR n=1 Tax=Thermoactinospora rubra TaxID=1088767 RepID=UPI000A12209F|nr:hypothetical protein [Thermoactinospora rubra]